MQYFYQKQFDEENVNNQQQGSNRKRNAILGGLGATIAAAGTAYAGYRGHLGSTVQKYLGKAAHKVGNAVGWNRLKNSGESTVRAAGARKRGLVDKEGASLMQKYGTKDERVIKNMNEQKKNLSGEKLAEYEKNVKEHDKEMGDYFKETGTDTVSRYGSQGQSVIEKAKADQGDKFKFDESQMKFDKDKGWSYGEKSESFIDPNPYYYGRRKLFAEEEYQDYQQQPEKKSVFNLKNALIGAAGLAAGSYAGYRGFLGKGVQKFLGKQVYNVGNKFGWQNMRNSGATTMGAARLREMGVSRSDAAAYQQAGKFAMYDETGALKKGYEKVKGKESEFLKGLNKDLNLTGDNAKNAIASDSVIHNYGSGGSRAVGKGTGNKVEFDTKANTTDHTITTKDGKKFQIGQDSNSNEFEVKDISPKTEQKAESYVDQDYYLDPYLYRGCKTFSYSSGFDLGKNYNDEQHLWR